MNLSVKLIHLFLFISLIPLHAQVIEQGVLEADHNGTLKYSSNYDDNPLNHTWKFVSKDGVKSTYTLILDNGKNQKSYDVRVRDLISTTYVEVRMPNKDGEIRTLSGIYKKTDKWLRVKMSASKDCKKADAVWGRYNQIKKFQEIIDHMIFELDKNVKLNCYI